MDRVRTHSEIERFLKEAAAHEEDEISAEDMEALIQMIQSMPQISQMMPGASQIPDGGQNQTSGAAQSSIKMEEKSHQLSNISRSNKEDNGRIKGTISNGSAEIKTPAELKSFTVRRLIGHTEPITAVSIEDIYLATGSSDTTVRLWDVRTGLEIRRYSGHRDTVTAVKLLDKHDSPSCAFVVVVSSQAEAHMEECQKEKKGCDQINVNVDFDKLHDSHTIISASLDCYIRIWNSGSAQCLRAIYTLNPLQSVAYLNNSRHQRHQIISGSDGSKLEVRSFPPVGNYFTAQVDNSAIQSIQIDCGRIICLTADGGVNMYDIEKAALKHTFKSNFPYRAIDGGQNRFSSGHMYRQTIYCGQDGPNITAVLWTNDTRRNLRNHTSEHGFTDGITVHKELLVASGYDSDIQRGYLNLRRLPDESYIGTLCDMKTGRIRCVAATSDSAGRVICATGGDELKVWYQQDPSDVRMGTEKGNEKSNGNKKSENTEGHSSDDSDDEDDDEAGAVNGKAVNKARRIDLIQIKGFRDGSDVEPEIRPVEFQREEVEDSESSVVDHQDTPAPVEHSSRAWRIWCTLL